MPSASLLVVETKRAKNSGINASAEGIGEDIVNKWNDSISIDGDYTLDQTPATDADGPDEILMPSGARDDYREQNKTDASCLQDLADDRIANNTGWKTDFDAILVLDAPDSIGETKGNGPYGNSFGTGLGIAAGSNDRNVAYADMRTKFISNSLPAHEVAHMFAGEHTLHKKKGVLGFTIMGNPGAKTCNGNKAELWRARNDKFSNCNIGSIQLYIDWCSWKKGLF